MAKRCVTQYALEGVSHNFMTFNDFSFLVDNPYYGTDVGNINSKISSYGDNICSIHSSDSEYIHAMDGTSALWQKELSTSYSGYTNFNMWLNNFNTIVISNGMLTREVSSRSVYWAVILDDEEEIGWVVARHVDSKCYVCGGHNDTGALIYYAFVRGVISPSGGAGSGYIGNSLLSNKKMVGYNVPTSDTASTKTESVNVYSASGEANKPKAGNGMARIKFLREYDPIPEEYAYIKIASTHKIGDAEQNWNLDSMPIYIGDDAVQFSTNDYCVMVAGNGPTVISNYITSGNYQNIGLYAKGRIDLNKVSGGSSYTLSFSGFTDIKPLNSYNHYYSMFPNTLTDPNRFQFYSGSNNDTIWNSFDTSFNNLGNALQYIYQHFRGILLYVDGERWL